MIDKFHMESVRCIKDISRTFANCGKKVLVVTVDNEFHQSLLQSEVDKIVDVAIWGTEESFLNEKTDYDVVVAVNIPAVFRLDNLLNSEKNSTYLVCVTTTLGDDDV